MLCRNSEHRMKELRSCGCNQCYREFRELEERYYRYKHYGPPRFLGVDLGSQDKSVAVVTNVIIKEKLKMIEEPKNIAVKLLVDKLKTEQATLSGAKSNVELYKNYVKIHTATKTKAENNIKELSGALKKLGHKDV